jgi:hypothetical protein
MPQEASMSTYLNHDPVNNGGRTVYCPAVTNYALVEDLSTPTKKVLRITTSPSDHPVYVTVYADTLNQGSARSLRLVMGDYVWVEDGDGNTVWEQKETCSLSVVAPFAGLDIGHIGRNLGILMALIVTGDTPSEDWTPLQDTIIAGGASYLATDVAGADA